MKLYEVHVEGTKYRVLSANIAQAIKIAVALQLDGRKEPNDLLVKVTASIVPAIEKVLGQGLRMGESETPETAGTPA